MATTVQLVASSYTTSSSPSVSVSNPSRAYTNASSTTYATVSPSSSSSSWADFYGFDFSQIPSGAGITSMTFKIKTKGIIPSSWSVYLRDTSRNQTISDTATHAGGSTYTDTLTPTKTFSQIIALGNNFHFRIKTSYSADVDVYGMEVNVTYATPVPNKVDYIKDGVSKTLIDLTGDDTLPEDVTAGKLFHLADGRQAVGTGGGLEYETGTWSPSSNTTTAPTISFSKTHTSPPAFIAMSKTGTGSNSQNAYLRYSWVDMSRAIADWGKPSSGTWYKSYEFLTYANTSTSEMNYTTTHTNDITRINGSSFEPYNGNSKTFRSTYVYNWIAIWA